MRRGAGIGIKDMMMVSGIEPDVVEDDISMMGMGGLGPSPLSCSSLGHALSVDELLLLGSSGRSGPACDYEYRAAKWRSSATPLGIGRGGESLSGRCSCLGGGGDEEGGEWTSENRDNVSPLPSERSFKIFRPNPMVASPGGSPLGGSGPRLFRDHGADSSPSPEGRGGRGKSWNQEYRWLIAQRLKSGGIVMM